MVGVSKDKEGNLDFSKAARLIKKNEIEVPKTLGEGREDQEERIEASPQKWLDEQRENAFRIWEEAFEQMSPGNIKQWVRDAFNPVLQENGRDIVGPDDLKSLQYIKAKSITASNISGKEIARPVLFFSDIGEYQKFSVKIQGQGGMASRGMAIPGESFADERLRETSLIISVGDKELISHEILHTIDPNLHKRHGYDRLLAEAFAYYQTEIINRDLQGFQHLENPEDGPWNFLARTIGGKEYWEKYVQEEEEKISEEEFRQKAEGVCGSIRKIQARLGHLETQRAIVQMENLEQLSDFEEKMGVN
mgnify:FL=1